MSDAIVLLGTRRRASPRRRGIQARYRPRELQEDLLRLEERVLSVSAEIENIADRDETARRLMTNPGVGPLGATAILASIGNPKRFKKARDVAAWLGLAPSQHSTGG